MIEQIKKELRELLDFILQEEEIPESHIKIKLEFKNNRRGRAHPNGRLVVPLWAIKEGVEYAYYYLIHEVSHFINRYRNFSISSHGPEFKDIELFWLVQFGLYPKYKKAYPKKLLSENGKVLWTEKHLQEN